MPKQITQSLADPDELVFRFKKGPIFMDAEDFTQLDDDLEIQMLVQPQYTHEEIRKNKEMGEEVASTMAGITAGVLILQCFLYLGINYMWNFMNLL